MSAAESRRPDRWPDATDLWLGDAGPQPGTALMPPASCRRHGAGPVMLASHAVTMRQAGGAWLPEISSPESPSGAGL